MAFIFSRFDKVVSYQIGNLVPLRGQLSTQMYQSCTGAVERVFEEETATVTGGLPAQFFGRIEK